LVRIILFLGIRIVYGFPIYRQRHAGSTWDETHSYISSNYPHYSFGCDAVVMSLAGKVKAILLRSAVKGRWSERGDRKKNPSKKKKNDARQQLNDRSGSCAPPAEQPQTLCVVSLQLMGRRSMSMPMRWHMVATEVARLRSLRDGPLHNASSEPDITAVRSSCL